MTQSASYWPAHPSLMFLIILMNFNRNPGGAVRSQDMVVSIFVTITLTKGQIVPLHSYGRSLCVRPNPVIRLSWVEVRQQWARAPSMGRPILPAGRLNPFPANFTQRVTWAIRAPLDAPYGSSETAPVLRDPWRW